MRIKMIKNRKLKIFLLIINIFLTLNTQIEENKTSDADDEIGKSVLVECPFSNMTKEMILNAVDNQDDLFYGSVCLNLADILNNQKLTEKEKNNAIDELFLGHYYKKTHCFNKNSYIKHFSKYRNKTSEEFFVKIYNDFKDRRHEEIMNYYYTLYFT